MEKAPFNRTTQLLLWAHPLDDAVLTISGKLPPSAAFVTLYGGLKDRAPRWGLSPIRVVVYVDGKILGVKMFPNAPGLHGISFPLPQGSRELTLEISTENTNMRHFLIDAAISMTTGYPPRNQSYIKTYIERDVGELLGIQKRREFERQGRNVISF